VVLLGHELDAQGPVGLPGLAVGVAVSAAANPSATVRMKLGASVPAGT
jgi:hypothetical protein